MSSPTISVQNYRYPFGQSTRPQTKVIQMHYFKTLDQLQQKKKQLTKKSQLINNQSIIKFLGASQKGMALVYNYQFVPHSFESYLRSKWQEQPAEIWTMTKKLFTKKVTFELTLLTSYLGKMKIETELATHHLGISKDEKLKLYISPKSKMGIKQEIQLIIVYNQNKQKILKELQQLYSYIQNNASRSNLMSENTNTLQENSNSSQSQIFSSMEMKSQYKQSSSIFSKLPLNPTQSFLRQTRTFKDSTSQIRPRKMSTGNFQLNSGANLFKNFQKPQETKTPKAHKYSFQFGMPSDQSSFHQTSFVEKQAEPQPSYSKSKSIKIELQQKQNLDSKKQRKDSYKVKITTVREYDLGENPTNMFGGAPNNEDDIFQYFAKRSKGKAEEQELSQDPEKSQDKYRKETADTNFTNQEIPEPTSPFSPRLNKERKQSQNSTSRNRLLEDRIRQAKQRTNKALNLMKNLKK